MELMLLAQFESAPAHCCDESVGSVEWEAGSDSEGEGGGCIADWDPKVFLAETVRKRERLQRANEQARAAAAAAVVRQEEKAQRAAAVAVVASAAAAQTAAGIAACAAGAAAIAAREAEQASVVATANMTRLSSEAAARAAERAKRRSAESAAPVLEAAKEQARRERELEKLREWRRADREKGLRVVAPASLAATSALVAKAVTRRSSMRTAEAAHTAASARTRTHIPRRKFVKKPKKAAKKAKAATVTPEHPARCVGTAVSHSELSGMMSHLKSQLTLLESQKLARATSSGSGMLRAAHVHDETAKNELYLSDAEGEGDG